MGVNSAEYRERTGESTLDLTNTPEAALVVDGFKRKPRTNMGSAAIILWLVVGTPTLQELNTETFNSELRKLL